MARQSAGELGRRLAWRGLVAITLGVAMVHRLGAQTSGPAYGASVLDRPLVLHVRGLSLRDAIDRIAAAAGLRISYSADVLPLDRAVRAAPDTGTVGGLLGAVLTGVAVRPVVAGSDQVVLAPTGRAPRDGAARDTAMVAAALDRVVVTGSTAGRIERALTLGTSVIEGRELAATGARDLATALDLAAPGVWVWPQSPTSVVTRFGSIRGASSFGANYPKVYVDGIAVANPLLVAGFDPENIQRIEVIRGPQGAALYGADAISGVVNIVTRRDLAPSGARIRASADAEVVSTDYAPTAAFGQSHRLAMDLGTPLRSAQVSIGASILGALYPGATSGSAQGSMTARLIGARTSFIGTARFYDARVGAASNPVLATPVGAAAGAAPAAQPQSLREYTVGGTIQHAGLGRWSQTAVLGVNGYVLDNVASEFTPFPSSADSALRAARGAALRTTLRMSTTARFGDDAAGGAITLAAEHSALRQQTADIDLAWEGPTAGPTAQVRPRSERWWALGSRGGDSGTPAPAVEWVSDAGVLAQADLAFHDTWFVTAGARVERNDGYLTSSRLNALPSLGAAWVGNLGGATVKLRAAYGRGMRAPRSAARETLLGAMGGSGYARDLGPEEQSGVEAGLDVLLGRALSIQVTRFDQLASGLIQQVVVPDSASASHAPSRLSLRYQDVGAISNRGWEAQATWRAGPLALSGAWSTVDSRVRSTAAGYTGELRPGDRMLDVPASTVAGSATWLAAAWSLSVSATRAADWVDYDRLALATAYTGFNRTAAPLYGADLRGYWREYPGNTMLSASFTLRLSKGLGLRLSGENLLDYQRGEPDNVTILPGRSISSGLRLAW